MSKVSKKTIGMFAVLVYFLSQYLSDVIPGGQLLTVVPLCILLFLLLKQHGLKVRKQISLYLIYIYGFAFFCALSMFWAVQPSLTIGKVNSVMFTAITMTVIYLYSYWNMKVDDLLVIMLYGGYITVFFISFLYGWDGIRSILSDNGRLSSDVINTNTLGMCSAYTILINIYYILNKKRRFIDVLIIPTIIIIAASGSRKALMIMVGGSFALFLFMSKNKDHIKRLFKILVLIIAFVGVIFLLNKIPFFSNIMNRMDDIFEYLSGDATRYTNTVWLRFAYINLGWKLFKENFLLGIGIGNASIFTNIYYGTAHYLHNNYIEMLACGGIVGFITHYWIYFYLLAFYIKHFRKHNNEFYICFIILIFKIIMDFGAVNYYSRPTYFYLLLLVMGVKSIKETINEGTFSEVIYPAMNVNTVKKHAY